MNDLSLFFGARHIVFVGASRTPGRLGHTLARNLVSRGFEGAVDFVNPQGGELFGRPVRVSIEDVPGTPDLAVLLIPARDVPQTLEVLARRGVPRAIVASGGFSESGSEGAELEHSLKDASTRLGLRLVGPNCVGLVDTGTGLDTSFLAGEAVAPGGVAFISHSGAICASVIEWSRDGGFGLSRLVSLGNQVDLGETDALEMIAEDPRSTVVCLYLERIGDGRRFMDVCDRLSRQKPVLALKAGRSAAGQRAATSHTGALAGHDVAFDAAFRASGVLRIPTTEDLVDAARVLSRYPGASARRLAILTNAGGPGVTAADAAEAAGLRVDPLAPETAAAVRLLLPPEASVSNPVDMLASATPEQYGGALNLLLADPSLDAVAILMPPPPGYPAELAAAAIVAAAQGSAKPVVVALMGSGGIEAARGVLMEGGIPVFRYPEQAVRALGWLDRARAAMDRPPREASTIDIPSELVRALDHGPEGWLTPSAALSVIYDLGISIPAFGSVAHTEQALMTASGIGYPVAIKVDSSDIVHKSDVGGVTLGIADAPALTAALESMRSRLGTSGRASAERFLVQAMAPAGHDLIVGLVRDPNFGPLIMVGTGGVDVELTRDVAFAPVPLSPAQALELVERTGARHLLSTHRGRPAIDGAGIVKALLSLAGLAEATDRLLELEINPLRVHADGSVEALDARVRLARVRLARALPIEPGI